MPNSNRQDSLVALVTGASTGIGKALAVKLGQEGYRVGMIARRPEVLADAETKVQRLLRDAGGELNVVDEEGDETA